MVVETDACIFTNDLDLLRKTFQMIRLETKNTEITFVRDWKRTSWDRAVVKRTDFLHPSVLGVYTLSVKILTAVGD